jgi:SIR2-like domain
MDRDMDEYLERHCANVLDAARDGEIVFLLGAGVNLCGRPPQVKWEPNGKYLPTGRELADYLAHKYRLPPDEPVDLARVAQYVTAQRGAARLSRELHELFDVEFSPTQIHRVLARLPHWLATHESPSPHQFIVTTNYDDVLERAFREAGAPFDLLVYMAHGEHRGRVVLQPPDGDPVAILEPNLAVDLGSERSVILKIHGAVDRTNADRDSWVITEEHYVEYLTQTDISTWMPVAFSQRLQESNLECLGYSLRDWNLRAILRRLRKDRSEGWKWWAVQLESSEVDKWVWTKHDLEILEARLEDYAKGMDDLLGG